MGVVNARILIKYRGDKPSDNQLDDWSRRIRDCIGDAYFFARDDGTPPDAYYAEAVAWRAAFEAHPLYPKYIEARHNRESFRDANADAPRQSIIADVGEFPEVLRRAIELTNRIYPVTGDADDVPPEYRQPGKAYLQDGPSILAEDGEWLLNVSLGLRYYGPVYRRGDINAICLIAEWIETNMQPCELWYGGDSSGFCAERFDVYKRFYLLSDWAAAS